MHEVGACTRWEGPLQHIETLQRSGVLLEKPPASENRSLFMLRRNTVGRAAQRLLRFSNAYLGAREVPGTGKSSERIQEPRGQVL